MANGWFGESRRHSEAAIKGKGGRRAPTERVYSRGKKIKVMAVTISFSEGPIHVGNQYPKTFSSIEAASRQLLSDTHTAPQGGAYDKHDFKITWADGNTYEGRADVKHINEPDNDWDISNHVKRHLRFIISSDPKAWKHISPEMRAEAKKLLERYQLE